MIKIEKIPYAGWQNCYRIDNSIIEVIATSDVGPRIISFGFKGKENLFYENPAEVGKTGGDAWIAYGGHRLWLSPELPKRTYYPDNTPVEVKKLDHGVQLISSLEKTTGIQKVVEIRVEADQSKIHVTHSLTNLGMWPVTFAPWALTVLGPDGVAVLPHPPRNHWPESMLPSHSISMWGYTRMSDPRWTWGDEYILLRQDKTQKHAQKIGMRNTSGWAAYVRNNTAFVKFFPYDDNAQYEDFGCNLESWTNPDFLELETLGALKTVGLEETVTYAETWLLAADIPAPRNDADVNKYLLPIVKKTLGK
jgi:hypothetical protein